MHVSLCTVVILRKSVCSGRSLVFSHQHHLSAWVWSKLVVGEASDVYHTFLRPKQQAGSANKHQRNLHLSPIFSFSPSLTMSPISLSITFSLSPASLDLPLSVPLMWPSRSGLKEKTLWVWDVSQSKYIPLDIKILVKARVLRMKRERPSVC